MVVTVGLYNHNGMIGSQIFKHLLPRAQKGAIKLVVLHRPNSNTTKIPDDSNVEKRMVDLEKPDKALNERSVQGIHVVISAAANQDRSGKSELVEALGTSKDLVTYIPADYGMVWTDYIPKYPKITFVQRKVDLDNKAKSLGISITNIRAGNMTPWMFTSDHGDFGINVKENRLIEYSNTMTRRLAITTPEWLGEKVAEIVSSTAPEEMANKSYSLIETWATGAEIAKAFTKANNKETRIDHIDEAAFAAKMDKGISDSLAAAIWQKWSDDHWEYDGKIVTGTKSVEQIAREMV